MTRTPRNVGSKTASKQIEAKGRKPTRRQNRSGAATADRVRETTTKTYGAPREERIAAGEFKARCLELMDQVRDRRKSIVITKHGVPVAQLVPYTERAPETFIGSMRGTVLWEGDLISPIDVEWDACADDPEEE